MDDKAERIKAIVEWLALHPTKAQDNPLGANVLENQVIADRTGMHRDTVAKARRGEISQIDKIRALEQFIEDYDNAGTAPTERTESTTDELAVVELYDVYGVGRVVVRAREGHVAEQVAETLRGIRVAMSQSGDTA